MSSPKPDWRSARTLSDFGRCTAGWLSGEIAHMPTHAHGASVSPEARRLLYYLARVNRSGRFLTFEFQPACLPGVRPYGGAVEAQRAAVQGFVPESAIDRVRRVFKSRSELTLVMSPPGTKSKPSSHLVGRNGGVDSTWLGYVRGPQAIAQDYMGLNPAMISALKEAWQVFVVDDKWGQNAILWDTLDQLA